MDKMDVRYHKRCLEARDFISTKKYLSMLKRSVGTRFYIGHNRWATQGSVNDYYSHPFDFENVIGVHNGTLWVHRALGPDGFSSESDSETIFAAINECPPGEPDEVIKKLDGSFALVWYDRRDGNLYAVRNKERPLSVLPIKDKKALILVSEAQLGRWIASRNKLTIAESAGTAAEGTLYCFNREDPTAFTSREVELLPPFNKRHGNYSRSGFGNRNYADYYNEYSQYKSDSKGISKVESSDGGDLVVGGDIEFTVYANEKRGNGRLIQGYYTNDPYPTCNCFVKLDNPQINPHIIKNNGIIKGSITKIKEDDSLGFVITVNFDEYIPPKFEAGIGEGKELAILYHGPDGNLVTLDEFNEITKDGCAYCTGNIYHASSHLYAWTRDKQPICTECMKTCGLNPGEVMH